MTSMKNTTFILLGILLLTGCGAKDEITNTVEEGAWPQPQENQQDLGTRNDDVSDVASSGALVETTFDESTGDALVGDAQDGVADAGQGVMPQQVVPSPLTPETNPEPREIGEAEQVEIDRKQAEAKICTEGGGLYNFSLGDCFKDAQDENAKTGSADEKIDILPTDDDETAERKDCINNGFVYNSEQKKCIKE
jgi:hypothetical protein